MLSHLIQSQYISEKNIEANLTLLRSSDPIAEELIRTIAERFFPGHLNLALKSKVIATLLVFYELYDEIPQVIAEMDVDNFLHELDALGESLPDTNDDDGGLQPLTE